MTGETKLAPCPFCGGEATIEHMESGRRSVGCTEASGEPCIGFQMLSSYATNTEAADAWNTRTPDLQSKLDRATEALYAIVGRIDHIRSEIAKASGAMAESDRRVSFLELGDWLLALNNTRQSARSTIANLRSRATLAAIKGADNA